MQFTFTPNSGNGNNYQWDFGNGYGLVTLGPASIPVSYSNPGIYRVCLLMSKIGKEKCNKCIEICVTESQVEDIPQPKNQGANSSSAKGSISINNLYPNPASNNFTLEIDAKKSGNGKLIVHDMTGKKISEKSVSIIEGNQSVKYQFSNLGKGMYLFTLVIEDERASKSFVIE